MTEVIGATAPYVLVGGLGLFALARVLPDYTQREKDKQEEAKKIGIGTVEPYGKCIDTYNCKGGGTSCSCEGGECVPLVQGEVRGTLFAKTPKELVLEKNCGKFYLGGFCSSCQYDSQCSADGMSKDAGDPSAAYGGITTKFGCVNNKCQYRGDRREINSADLYNRNLSFWGILGGVGQQVPKCQDGINRYIETKNNFASLT